MSPLIALSTTLLTSYYSIYIYILVYTCDEINNILTSLSLSLSLCTDIQVEAVNQNTGEHKNGKAGAADSKTKGRDAKKRDRRKETIKTGKASRRGLEERSDQTPKLSLLDKKVDGALCDAQLRHIVTLENQIVQARLQRVMRNCQLEVSRLKQYAESDLYPRFEHWLALRVKGENASIDTLLFLIKSAVEREEPIYHRIRLEGADVFVDKDLICTPIPELPLSGPFSGLSDPHAANRFSAPQLDNLARQLRRYASSNDVVSAAQLEEVITI